MLKLPPQNLEAEQSVLGAIIFDGDSFRHALQVLNPSDFYKKSHEIIFATAQEIYEQKMPIDIITMSNALKAKNALETVGGLSYLSHLANLVPTSANIQYHAQIVKEKAQKRQLLATCMKTMDALYEDNEFNDILSQHRLQVSSITSNIGSGIVSMRDIAKSTISFVERRYENRHDISGIRSGLSDLDEITDGFQNGDLIIIGARPGIGKSAFAMSILQQSEIPSGVVSLEMSDHQIGIRTLTSLAGIEMWRLRKGHIMHGQWDNIVKASGQMAELPIWFSFSARKASAIEKVILEMIDRHGVKTIMVDYLQLVRSDSGKQNREREIAEVSNMLKAIAVDYKIPVFAIAQLNRELERREDKRPILADLRDSGSIEQDADMVLFLYRDEYYNPNSPQKGIMEVIVAKGRNTGTGKVKVVFDGDRMQFKDMVVEGVGY